MGKNTIKQALILFYQQTATNKLPDMKCQNPRNSKQDDIMTHSVTD